MFAIKGTKTTRITNKIVIAIASINISFIFTFLIIYINIILHNSYFVKKNDNIFVKFLLWSPQSVPTRPYAIESRVTSPVVYGAMEAIS